MASKTDKFIPFEVIQEDIDDGGHGAATCPTARAIHRVVGMYVQVGWLIAAIYWGDTKQVTKTYAKPKPVYYKLDKRTMDQIHSYDTLKGMVPYRGVLERE